MRHKRTKKFFKQFMQHRWNTINQDVSTHGSSSAEKQLNCSKNFFVHHTYNYIVHMFVAVNVLCIRLSDAYILMMTRVKCLTAAYMTRHPPCGRASSEEDLVKRCSSTALVTSFLPVTTWKHSYMIGRGRQGREERSE